MYTPKYFFSDEDLKVKNLIEKNSFATILSFPKDSSPFINHLPVIFDPDIQDNSFLIGHMAKRNPQWLHFKENPKCTIVIQGGHTYITPNWYRSGRDVPTWNYAVVHLHGRIELIEHFSEQIEVLKKLTHFFETPSSSPWKFELPDDLLDESALTSAIISFRFKIEKTEAKFKLSQNRSAEDKAGVIDGLKERTDNMSRIVREMMLGEDK